MLMMACVLWSCEAVPQTESNEDVLVTSNDSEIFAKGFSIGKHEYYVVYATCDGHEGHTVRLCSKNHCFLLHSHDCPCRKVQPAASMVIDEEEESTDPFDW